MRIVSPRMRTPSGTPTGRRRRSSSRRSRRSAAPRRRSRIARVDEELSFRAGEKRDEDAQATAIVQAVAAQSAAAAETPEDMVLTTARSAQLDRVLDGILAEQDREKEASAARHRQLVG